MKCFFFHFALNVTGKSYSVNVHCLWASLWVWKLPRFTVCENNPSLCQRHSSPVCNKSWAFCYITRTNNSVSLQKIYFSMEEWISVGRKSIMKSVFFQNHMKLEDWRGYSCTVHPNGDQFTPSLSAIDLSGSQTTCVFCMFFLEGSVFT
jgi:hypothetical protein